MIRSIIVEDEHKLSMTLKQRLVVCAKDVEILAICDNIPDAIEQVKLLKPELIFLDVDLPPYTGFDLLNQTKMIDYKVIFTTGHSKFSIQSHDYHPIHYLLKPIQSEQLKDAIQYYKTVRNSGEATLFIPVKNGEKKIKITELIFCQASLGNTMLMFTDGKEVTISKTLAWTEELFSPYNFLRTHDTYLVNRHHAHAIQHEGEGAILLLSNGYKALVSKRRKAAALKWLTDK